MPACALLANLRFLLPCFFVAALGGCEAVSEKPAAVYPRAIFQKIEPEEIKIFKELSGRVSALLTAEVRPEVGGILLEMLFTEGAAVQAGDILYKIDPSTCQAAYEKAGAELSLAKADLEAAARKEARYGAMIKSRAVSQQDYEDAQAGHAEIKARISVMEAALKEAAINLDRTSVRAPIAGRIGRSYVTPGALVTAGQAQPLAIIRQLEKVYVDVKLPVTEWLRMRDEPYFSDGQDRVVTLVLENGEKYSAGKDKEIIRGELIFTDVTVAPETGAVNVRAVFPNPDGILLHGMYGRVILENSMKKAILVPPRAVRHDRQGNALALVLVKNAARGSFKVEERVVSTGPGIEGRVLVKKGLKQGDMLVVDGFLYSGQELRPEEMQELLPEALKQSGRNNG